MKNNRSGAYKLKTKGELVYDSGKFYVYLPNIRSLVELDMSDATVKKIAYSIGAEKSQEPKKSNEEINVELIKANEDLKNTLWQVHNIISHITNCGPVCSAI